MAARLTAAFEIQMTDTRSAMCAGFLMRSSFAPLAQMPHFIAPGIDQLAEQALEPVSGRR